MNNYCTPRSASEIYLLSLQSIESRKTMVCFLNRSGLLLQNKKSHDKVDWGALHYEDILNLLSMLGAEKKAPATINSYLSALKGVAREAWRKKLLTTEHYTHIKEIKRVRGQREIKGRALPLDELNKLINHCLAQHTDICARDAAMIAVIYGAGLRREECASLKRSDLDLKDSSLRIMGKGNKERKNYLCGRSIELLKDYLLIRGNASGFLFYRGIKSGALIGQGISSQAVYDILARRQKKAGVPHLTPHDLRRTFATNLLNEGVDIFTVQNLMGHANVDTTKHYDKRSKEVQKIAALALPF
jgi:integrase/recombinase XerD